MAEARLGVVPTPALHRAGYEVDTSIHKTQLSLNNAGLVLYVPHPRFILRNLRRTAGRLWTRVEVSFMPISAYHVLAIVSAASVWVANSPSTSWQRSGWLANTLWKVDSLLPFTSKLPTKWRVSYLAFATSLSIMAAFTGCQRMALRKLLQYQSWLYERREKSTLTKVWGLILKGAFVGRIHKKLQAYQTSLPTLPLPSVENTVSRYMSSMRGILSDEEYAELDAKAKDFVKNEGRTLQWYLRLKWLFSRNYISDWWLNYVYLRGRESLCVNSNWYGILFAEYSPSTRQVSRAASTIFELVKRKRQLDTETFEPQVIGGMVPLCMAQYDSVFSTTRVPHREQDVLVKYEPVDSRHIVVIHKGRFYKVPVFSPRTMNQLSALQLESALKGIVDSPSAADPVESKIPALTTMNRTEWADIREELFLKSQFNRQSLHIVESAMFVVSLDDDDEPTTSLNKEAKSYLCGNGANRWSDKSFTAVVQKNGNCGLHVEHSWGDAPTMAHIIEYVACAEEFAKNYNEDGTIKPSEVDLRKKEKNVFDVYPAERVRFQITPELAAATDKAFNGYRTQIDDTDLYIRHFTKYGKGLVKRAKCSPDAWLQTAMQLAYFRDQGRFDQTYESSMTRLFKDGRTETIRSCSVDTCNFVRSMEDTSVSKEDRVKLLHTACDNHQQTYLDAMTGKGVDRHLFGLYVVSVGKEIESPFLQAALGRKWKLSTSQVPTRQLPKSLHHKDEEKFHTPNGGFGPVADDGYGCSYCIFGENMFYFNVSSKFSCPKTSSERFSLRIMQALEDMARLFEDLE